MFAGGDYLLREETQEGFSKYKLDFCKIRNSVCNKSVSQAGLLRTSTSSPSRNFEALVRLLKVVANVIVLSMGPMAWVFVIGEQISGIQSRSLWTETRNLKIQDGEDVDVLRRSGPRSQNPQ